MNDPAVTGRIEMTITPKERDLGEFTVRRVLPDAKRRMVGPFVFFDHMGPAEFPPGKGIAVRPHPHIGLATITTCLKARSCTAMTWAMCSPSRPALSI